MRKSLLGVAAGLALSGCGTIRLDAIPEQCRSDPTAPKHALETATKQVKATTATSEAMGLSQLQLAKAVPFSSPRPSADEVKRWSSFNGSFSMIQGLQPTEKQKAVSANAVVLYSERIKATPFSEDLPAPTEKLSDESAQAVVDLYSVMQEVFARGRMASQALVAATDTAAVNVLTLGRDNGLSLRLHRAVQSGADGEMVRALAAAAAEQAVVNANLSGDALTKGEELLAERIQAARSASFVWTYLRLYFRNGRVLQTEVKTKEFEDAFIAYIKSKLPPDEPLDKDAEAKLRKETSEKLAKICRDNDSGCLLTSLGKTTLVTRSGENLQFKGLSLAIGYESGKFQTTWDSPKSVEFAPQLVRVVMEAAFDSADFPVPAVGTASVCLPQGKDKVKLYPDWACLTPDTLDSDWGKVAEPWVATIDEKGAKADSLAASATGQLIRGLNIGALNNEALAKSLENWAGVTARKVTERVTWEKFCTSPAPTAYIRVSN